MRKKAVILGVGLSLFPLSALAGVVDGNNPFVNQADHAVPFGSATPAPAQPPAAPNLPTTGGSASGNPPFQAPGESATGFTALHGAQVAPQTGLPQTVVHSHPAGAGAPAPGLDGYQPFPKARAVLPPPLP
ncbi:hypothetical protein JKG47_21340, partial [Acidithiobacillus sp. MC6.1]|nr:hypothetical protein [Acidithiobacillus sp. MC6.1]